MSENGTTIKNNGNDDEEFRQNLLRRDKLAELCLVSQQHAQHETKTVVVEVHRSSSNEKEKKTENSVMVKSSSTSSLVSKSSTASSSLSSAICEEIQRRAQVIMEPIIFYRLFIYLNILEKTCGRRAE